MYEHTTICSSLLLMDIGVGFGWGRYEPSCYEHSCGNVFHFFG